MNGILLGWGIVFVIGSLSSLIWRRRGWLILTGFGLLLVALAFNPPTWVSASATFLFFGLAIIAIIGLVTKGGKSFIDVAQATASLMLLIALVGLGFGLASQSSNNGSAAQQAQGNLALPSGAGDHATVTDATATESCRANAADSYLKGQGFKAASYTVGEKKINHAYTELTATGSARFGAASTSRKELQKFLNSDSGPAKANLARLKEKFPDVPERTLRNANNWEVFQSKVPMSIHGNTGWENGQPVSLGTRSSAAGDATWLYVDPVTCKVPAASPKYDLAAMVKPLNGTQSDQSTRAVGVIRVGCSNPGDNVTPGHPKPTPTHKPKPTHTPKPSHSTPAPCKYDSHKPADSKDCKPTPKPTPSENCGCETPTPTPTPTETTPKPTDTPTPTPTPSESCGCETPTPTPTPTESTHTPTPTPTPTETTPKPTDTPTPTPTPTHTNTPTPTPTPSETCKYGKDENGNCKKSPNPGDYSYPTGKPPAPAHTEPAQPKPSAVVTEKPGGGGVVDSPTKAPGSETGGNAPGAAPAPASPRPVPVDEGGAPAPAPSDTRSPNTNNPLPSAPATQAPNPVHTTPVTQPAW